MVWWYDGTTEGSFGFRSGFNALMSKRQFPLPCIDCRGTPWARAANFVKKPPLIVNGTYLESNVFNASMWVSWSPLDPQKSQSVDRYIQIHQICVNKHGYYNYIKFEVSLHFWLIWPTVRHSNELVLQILPHPNSCQYAFINYHVPDFKKLTNYHSVRHTSPGP